MCTMADRQIPITVPTGWAPDRWANYCDHMERAVTAGTGNAEAAREWKTAAAFARRIHQTKQARRSSITGEPALSSLSEKLFNQTS